MSGEDEDVYLSHFGHFVEAVASALLLEAVDALPMPHAVLCCGCGPHLCGQRAQDGKGAEPAQHAHRVHRQDHHVYIKDCRL